MIEQNKNAEKLHSLREAAEFLNVSSVTLKRQMKSGKLGHFKIGKRVLFSMEKHIQPFLNNCEQNTGNDQNQAIAA